MTLSSVTAENDPAVTVSEREYRLIAVTEGFCHTEYGGYGNIPESSYTVYGVLNDNALELKLCGIFRMHERACSAAAKYGANRGNAVFRRREKLNELRFGKVFL